MANLPQDLRERAKSLRASSKELLENPALQTDAEMQITLTVAQVTQYLYDALADMTEYLDGKSHIDRMMATRKRIADLNHRIRTAKDVHELDGILAGITGSGGNGGGAGSPGEGEDPGPAGGDESD
jgi:S-adenosylmethionine synthetase